MIPVKNLERQANMWNDFPNLSNLPRRNMLPIIWRLLGGRREKLDEECPSSLLARLVTSDAGND
jgi:hypothetical protein